MCLAIAGQVLELTDGGGLFARGRVDFGGAVREVSLICTPEVAVGDWVLVHAGLAIARIDAEAADRARRELARLAAAL
ncbi:MAG: HypC/HybG/HupF family hydrogenase formation chaperone [Immundisolibacter sp.]|uniref:HypC/HybG/HupF family hydrogenase formation chaperone n=1 Tax=Immundisolibacter sp. TaxID=1934948 RepID=UPI001985A8F8|nr:HypC/HybG/HupF family hydrogenase formation chaperone [Immundisolibacter sp.]MBC7162552.1 HypC/HybG/HupF family hydrogenase formation chaperone [Immundisolibacter sp.]